MKKFFALVAAFLMGSAAIRNCYLIYNGDVQPVLATWLLFSTATSIGICTYMKADSRKDFVTNIANTMDVVVSFSIFLCLLVFGEGTRYSFTEFEVICIVLSVCTFIYWKISNRAGVANVAINIIMVLAYLPTFVSLLGADVNEEAFSFWGIVLLYSLVAMVIPIKERDKFAILYAARSAALAALTLMLMLRIEFFG